MKQFGDHWTAFMSFVFEDFSKTCLKNSSFIKLLE